MLGANRRMMTSYNRHGREQSKVVQLTCDGAVEREFLGAMCKEGIKLLPPSNEPLKLTHDYPARGEKRRQLKQEHACQVEGQCKRSAEAFILTATRENFETLVWELEGRRERIHIEQAGRRSAGMEERINRLNERDMERVSYSQKRQRISTPQLP